MTSYLHPATRSPPAATSFGTAATPAAPSITRTMTLGPRLRSSSAVTSSTCTSAPVISAIASLMQSAPHSPWVTTKHRRWVMVLSVARRARPA
eukprot:5636229-Alexandrium_andersonii.AAC.1